MIGYIVVSNARLHGLTYMCWYVKRTEQHVLDTPAALAPRVTLNQGFHRAGNDAPFPMLFVCMSLFDVGVRGLI